MTFSLSQVLEQGHGQKHHALLLLCSKFSEDSGLPPAAFVTLAQGLCQISLPSPEDEEFWKHCERHPDVFVADRERNILRLEDVEAIKNLALYPPSLGTRRLFFIDRCERLNANAANSLLKLIEEPPAPALFLLTAKNQKSVLSTIASRCLKVPLHLEDLRRPSPHEQLDAEDWQWLSKHFSPSKKSVVTLNSTWESGLNTVSTAALAEVVEKSEKLSKKYSADELQSALASLLSEHWKKQTEPTALRFLSEELKAWREARPLNPSTQLWLMSLLVRTSL